MRTLRELRLKLGLFFLLLSTCVYAQGKDKFTIVLDAGHGGKDYGAVYGEFIEKNIALKVVLKIGEILEKDPSIDVIYTRKEDVFVELIQRAAIANKADANFFLSVHCNASKSPASGTETFVMGMTKIASNLEVAKKENAVISLENDYKLNYGGYDPNSIESVIGLSMLQEEYLDQSIALASMLQNEYTGGLNRKNRGVKQAPFLVLHRTFMPSVLTELGFISNYEEGKYLNSEEGQNKISTAIAQAILSYKKGYMVNSSLFAEKPVVPEPEKSPAVSTNTTKGKVTPAKKGSSKSVDKTVEETLEKGNKQLVYKIQIAAGGSNIKNIPANFKGLDSISVAQIEGKYKYYYGETPDYEVAKKLLKRAKEAGYQSSFITTFNNK
jgi:N-acetylmuramoyl-L-alanine amidase